MVVMMMMMIPAKGRLLRRVVVVLWYFAASRAVDAFRSTFIGNQAVVVGTQNGHHATLLLRAKGGGNGRTNRVDPRSLIREDDALQSELYARAAPLAPSPELSVEEVAKATVRGLQRRDTPHPMAGIERLYNFATYKCRKAVTARQGADSLERFVQYTETSPAIRPFIACDGVRWLDTPTIIEGTKTRGRLATIPVEIIARKGFRHPSGFERAGADDVKDEYETRRFVLRLEQQRRPPLQDCWLVDELLDVRHVFAGDMGNDAVAN